MTLPNSIDGALRARARRVVPGGMWGHQNVARIGPGYPQFFDRADGTRIWDVDGNAYTDFMCSWGPIILGHHAPEVEEAVRRQQGRGDCMNGPGEAMVELAELLVDTIPHADWVQFEKNGSDATTVAVTLARAGTGRRKLLVARGAYHGAVPWCS
ncbi:MAG: aminotransferase class III-fold pyridoxal phosphate-dependent enzyme, partial [Rhodospirillales bacterium]|nr:aminotransferase class III-fold pyridoxal phosphate-dependent enzyme [Rhodospirillales bacterium]